jgi:hypothetical protein
MADPNETESPGTPSSENEDDRRASAAAANRKRALDQWESNKKRWLKTGVPPASPAAGSSKK